MCHLLVDRIDAMKIGVPELPGNVQTGPEMVEHRLKLKLAGKCLGADFFPMIDVVLLDLDLMVNEAAS